jgi:hypothetical protein
MPSSVLAMKTLSVKMPRESLPKSAPSPFAVSRLCETVTAELPRTPSTPFMTVSPLTTLPPARDPNSSTALPAQPEAPPHAFATYPLTTVWSM